MKTIQRILWPCLLISVMLAMPVFSSACSGGTTAEPATTSSSAPSGNAVSMSNLSFSPASLTVSTGTTVTWTNKDTVAHTVTSDTGSFDSGNMAPKATFSFKFNTAGTFAYHCSLHPSMKGTVTVK